MHRCSFPSRPLPLLALCGAVLLAAAWAPSHAQPSPSAAAAGQRTFPATASRGTLRVLSRTQMELDGKPVRLAPGLRIFNEKNALVFAHSLTGRTFTVNYVPEASTGRLHTVWVLTPAEAERARKGSAPAFQTQPAL